MDLSFLYKEGEFNAFTTEHWTPVAIVICFGVLFIWIGKKFLTENQNWRFLFLISLLPAFGYFWMLFSVLYDGSYNTSDDLPIHVCRFIAIATPFVIRKKSRFAMGLFYFWILVGTLNAVITPDIEFGYPHWNFFTYWMMHAFLIIIPLYYVIVLGIRINIQDLKNAFWYGNLYLVISLGINYLLGSNYMYSLRKPDSATVLDYMGAWPIYLFTVQGLGLVLFILVYLPFVVINFRKKKALEKA